MRDCFDGREGFLYNLLSYQLGWVDQQGQPAVSPRRLSFHSLIAPAASEALTGEFTVSLPVGAAIELIHNFSLVHGDVQAGRVDAQNRPSIWWVWGPAQAINAGDGFHAMGRVAVMRLKESGVPAATVLSISRLLDRACLSMCEGQFSDLGFQDRMLVTPEEYYEMIARKTGSLTGCGAAAGAMAVGSSESRIETLKEMGTKLGMAWQINQDIAEFWGRDADGVTASNVLNKKKSLPLILALERSSIAAKREIGSIYMKRVLEPADMSRIIVIMNETEARSIAEARAEQLVEEALQLLGSLGLLPERQAGLRALAELASTVQTQS